MKLIWTLALVAIGWIGLFANARAVAQYGPSAPAAARQTAYVAQNAPATQESPNSPAPEPSSQAPNGVPTASPDAMLDLPPDTSMLIDNGLWDGAPVGSCCAICGGGSGCPPDWYTEQGVRLLGRTRPREIILGSEPIIIDFRGTPIFRDPQTRETKDVLTNRSASPDMSVAYATTVGHYFARDTFNRDHFVEFSFWGLNGWKDQAAVTALTENVQTVGATTTVHGSLYTPYFTGEAGTYMRGFDGAQLQTSYYSSYNNNFEINGRISPRSRNDRLVLHPNGKWRRECQPGQYMSYLYGIRFMQVNETFRFHSEGQTNTYVGDTLISSDNYAGDYDIMTRNNLLGLQVGADMMFRQCRWAWGVRSKVGAFVNFSNQISTIVSPDLTRIGDNELSAAKHEASLIGEVGFTATYKFRPNLMGRAGYDFMWVTGLALAPEQLQFVPSPVNMINTNGTTFYHGISLGLEWMW